MIVVDTSVWIPALRSSESPEAVHLRNLLDADKVALAAPVRVEILIGSSLQDRPRLRRTLSALPVFYPTGTTWETIDAWVDRASAAGETFGFADLLIGVLAVEQGAEIWSLDSDFRRMAEIGLIKRFQPV